MVISFFRLGDFGWTSFGPSSPSETTLSDQSRSTSILPRTTARTAPDVENSRPVTDREQA